MLNPPLNPPQVIINEVLFSNFLKNDKILIGIETPIPLEETTKTMVKRDINKYPETKFWKIGMISSPIKINSIAFKVSSSKCQNFWLHIKSEVVKSRKVTKKQDDK